jgi:hypothetical protein
MTGGRSDRLRSTGVEDASVLPYLACAEPALAPVIQRLADEHLVIHDAIDFLTDAPLSHLYYEEHEIFEPLARLGFYAGQV